MTDAAPFSASLEAAPSRPAHTRAPHLRSRGVTAVLGPTNTGKTHLALERMVAHRTGVIGLPLRLLAREVYGRLRDRVGEDAVALVTGEEKIIPPKTRYWVSTVEAMPRDVEPDFLAIDEVQLAASLERGHVFTDRILYSRGLNETLLLGSDTARPLLERLLPGLAVMTRPRMSILAYTGEKKVTRLPRRTAAVAFSSGEVYAIAELIRRQRGGAAVVMGALSPRTRNAQVELYQNGDVDYLVATDAIGMGLNLDVDHIAFSSMRKFDGFQHRFLTLAEMGQIAGRAGRYKNDGTFGTTGRAEPLDDAQVEKIETHNFDALKVLQWRNPDLDFGSVDRLTASLDVIPREPGLTRAPPGPDVQVLDIARKRPEIMDLAATRDDVIRLWEACLVPDYRKTSPNAHADLVFSLFERLSRGGRIDKDWFAAQIKHGTRVDGDIDTLSHRIAHMRTWTFVANRPDWLDDAAHWQDTTREIEDKLSDALHERLVQRFVDRRTSVLMRRLRENAMLEAEISPTGEVLVEGQNVGRLEGFVFAPARTEDSGEAKALRNAAQAALGQAIGARADKLVGAGDAAFILSSDAVLRWDGQPVAKLEAGEDVLAPRVRLIADEHLTGPHRDKVQERLDNWVAHHVLNLLRPLLDLRKAEALEGISRGVAYRVAEELGILPRTDVADDVKQIEQTERAKLRALGLRFGAHHLYLPALLKPAPRALTVLLWSLKNDLAGADELSALPAVSMSGRTSFARDTKVPDGAYLAAGYVPAGELCVRVDILERLADLIRPAATWREGSTDTRPKGAMGGGFRVTGDMTSLLGASAEATAAILKSLGYKFETRTVPVSVLAALDAGPTPSSKPAPAAPETTAEKTPKASGPEADASSEPGAPTPAEAATVEPVAAEAEPAETATVETATTETATVEAEPTGVEADAASAPSTESDGTAPEAGASEAAAPADADGSASTEGGEKPTADGAPATDGSGDAEETVEVQVWRMARRQGGGRRDARGRDGARGAKPPVREHKGRKRRADGPGGKDAPRNHGGKGGPKRDRAGGETSGQTPPPRRAADPDSPFAALAALKANLSKKD